MSQKLWKTRIKKACGKAGTYKPEFDYVVSDLAKILERREQVEQLYEESGSNPVVEYTNKAGATNYVKNPMLILWNDLNNSALAYWRELGLTPAGLKKIKDNSFSAASKAQENDLLEKLRRKREENGRV